MIHLTLQLTVVQPGDFNTGFNANMHVPNYLNDLSYDVTVKETSTFSTEPSAASTGTGVTKPSTAPANANILLNPEDIDDIYVFEEHRLAERDQPKISLAQYAGKVLLISNIATD